MHFALYNQDIMFVPNRELGDFLIDARLMTRADVARLGAEGSENLFEIIQSRNLVPEDELTRAAAHVLGIPFKEILHEEIDPEALLLVPEPLARAHSMALFKMDGHTAHVMLVDADALGHLRFIEDEHHLRPVATLTDRASIKRALMIHQKHLKERFAQKLKNSAPDVALDALISHALLSRASEIYLDQREGGELRARYRIGGMVHEAMMLPASARTILPLLKEAAGLSLTLNAPQEGRFKMTLKSSEVVRVGVFTLFAAGGESVLVHLSPEVSGKNGFTLDALGFHGEALADVHSTLSARSGLMLVAAPQGHGKTTTLYTLLEMALHPSVHTISVEEHVELVLPQATQIEIKKDLGQTYASATRAALRHNPDILMIADIKDEDTAALAASATSRGILVLAGIKTSSAAKAIQKMLTLGVEPLLLSATLRLAAGERVVKKLCPHCKEAYKPARADIAALEERASFAKVLAALKAEGIAAPDAQWKDIEFYKTKGCEQCEGGYKGSTALFEVLPVSAITKELILDTEGEREEREAKMGSEVPLSLAEDGLFKAAAGLTTIEEVAKALEA